MNLLNKLRHALFSRPQPKLTRLDAPDGAGMRIDELPPFSLKTAEGTAKQIAEYLRAAMNRTFLARIGYFLARDAFERLREKMDPRRGNGGVFLGLNGIVVKSHGNANEKGVANAIRVAGRMVREDLTRKIAEDLANIDAHRAAVAAQ